jgi:hypothetical protein
LHDFDLSALFFSRADSGEKCGLFQYGGKTYLKLVMGLMRLHLWLVDNLMLLRLEGLGLEDQALPRLLLDVEGWLYLEYLGLVSFGSKRLALFYLI